MTNSGAEYRTPDERRAVISWIGGSDWIKARVVDAGVASLDLFGKPVSSYVSGWFGIGGMFW